MSVVLGSFLRSVPLKDTLLSHVLSLHASFTEAYSTAHYRVLINENASRSHCMLLCASLRSHPLIPRVPADTPPRSTARVSRRSIDLDSAGLWLALHMLLLRPLALGWPRPLALAFICILSLAPQPSSHTARAFMRARPVPASGAAPGVGGAPSPLRLLVSSTYRDGATLQLCLDG